MSIVYYNSSDEPWGNGGAIFINRDAAEEKAQWIAKALFPIKQNDKFYRQRRDEIAEELAQQVYPEEKYHETYEHYMAEDSEFRKEVNKMLFDEFLGDILRSLEVVLIEEADQEQIDEIKYVAEKNGWPSEKIRRAVELRERDLIWEHDAARFYGSAHVTNTIFRGGKGTAKLTKRYNRLIRSRYLKTEEGESRKTVEIELTTELERNIMEYEEGDCAERRLPEIAIASDHFLMFRCPDGCNQNSSIQFVSLEDYSGPAEEEGALTFNLSCHQCGNAYHYKIIFGPYYCHTAYGLNWEKQVEYFSSDEYPFAPKAWSRRK